MRLHLFLYPFLLTLCATAMPFAATPSPTANPLTSPWGGPYGGVPPFDRVRVEDLAAALVTAELLFRVRVLLVKEIVVEITQQAV